jgi:glycerol-3-phosphate dehydrogenase
MDTKASPSQRATLAALTAKAVDVLVVEQNDLGSGTSSRSSRLIHGGLRYLEYGHFRLVLEASRERRILLQIAPHLVHPLPFVFPVHRNDRVPLWKLIAGMWLYDALAAFRNVRRHRPLSKRGVLEAEPMLRERGLVGGALYYDAQCDDARLTIATARSAIAHGALVANYMPVETLVLADGTVRGVHVRDALTGQEAVIHASVVVNATGPWSDTLRRMEDPEAPPLLRPTKGAHVMVPRSRLGNTHAVVLTSPIDGRVMFVLPWGDLAYVGTTDTDCGDQPEGARATSDDVVYLLRSANAYFPNARLTENDVVASWAGLRPMLAGSENQAASERSREHKIRVGRGGMLSIVGGKLTTYRIMARDVVNLAVRRLHELDGARYPSRTTTDEEPLPGGEAQDLQPFHQTPLDLGVPPETVDHLLRHYGTETAAICNLIRDDRTLLRPLSDDHPAIEAEVVHSTRRELPQHVDDFLIRRIHSYYEVRDRGAASADRVAALMGAELGWDSNRMAGEVERYSQLLATAATQMS